MKPSCCVAGFDSATGMVRALASYLRGNDFPLLGIMPKGMSRVLHIAATLLNHAPSRLREQVYIWSGRFEAVPSHRLGDVNLDLIDEDLLRLYPWRGYPAVAVGSSNGAAVHLWAALGIPWLPQTLLIPVARSGIGPDEPAEDALWGKDRGRRLLDANPHIQLHHMNDPVQDRLMIQRMTYFRVKRLRLGAIYKSFLEKSLRPGGTIFVVECNLEWPTTQLGDRHFFQFGALGGASIDEYQNGGSRVEAYLKRYGSRRRRWQPPPPNTTSPEAEWGFEPALNQDIELFARQHGFQIKRIVFREPEELSPLVSDLYHWWNNRRGIIERRLLVESFILMEPFWVLGTGSVPFWMVFNKSPSAEALTTYLRNQGDLFDEIHAMLFSHGVDSIGLVPIEEWRRIMNRHAKTCSFVGVDQRAYPRDFAVFVRYHDALLDAVPARYPMPAPLTLEDLEVFLQQTDGRYHVEWH